MKTQMQIAWSAAITHILTSSVTAIDSYYATVHVGMQALSEARPLRLRRQLQVRTCRRKQVMN